MLRELTRTPPSTSSRVTVICERVLKGLPRLCKETYLWIPLTKVCICSAAADGSGSRGCFGKETVFCSCTNDWTAACSVGRGMRPKRDFLPSRRSVGFWRAWRLSNQKLYGKVSPEYCTEICMQFKVNLSYGNVCRKTTDISVLLL